MYFLTGRLADGSKRWKKENVLNVNTAASLRMFVMIKLGLCVYVYKGTVLQLWHMARFVISGKQGWIND